MVSAWRVWAVMGLVIVSVQGDDQWVWRRSARDNRKASSIPGYVEPRPPLTTTTPSPPITTFRPSFRGLRRGASQKHFPRASAHPFFLGPFSPFSLVPINPPRPANDGTTKSRVPIDTVFDGAVLDAGDKYTTLDRLQRERGAPPPLPRPKQHQLGGLHPDEVFYADDDLLIIKGGGFNSDAFEEPSQTLDDDDHDVREGSPSRVSSVVVPLPSPHHEYNGNIPAIVPPPHQMTEHPFSLFVEAASDKDYIIVPHIRPRPGATVVPAPNTFTNHLDDGKGFSHRNVATSYLYSSPTRTASFLTRPISSHYAQALHTPARTLAYQYLPIHNSIQLPHSLAGDTDVNFRNPRPNINPEAEVFRPKQSYERYVPWRTRQQGRPRV